MIRLAHCAHCHEAVQFEEKDGHLIAPLCSAREAEIGSCVPETPGQRMSRSTSNLNRARQTGSGVPFWKRKKI